MNKSNRSLKKYLAVFLGSASAMKKWEKLSAKVQKEREEAGIKAWQAWVQENHDAIVYMGAPLGSTKKVNRKGTNDASNDLAAFTIVQAKSHAAAAKIFKDHPHFTFFPGDSIEIMPCLNIPGM